MYPLLKIQPKASDSYMNIETIRKIVLRKFPQRETENFTFKLICECIIGSFPTLGAAADVPVITKPISAAQLYKNIIRHPCKTKTVKQIHLHKSFRKKIKFAFNIKTSVIPHGVPSSTLQQNAVIHFKILVSDNMMQLLLLRDHLYCTPCETITWKLIPQYSPWMGGVYEKLITFKRRPTCSVV